MPINIGQGESEQDFISRCIAEEINNGYEQDQAAAICYSYLEKGQSTSEQKLSVDEIKKMIKSHNV